MPRKRTQHDNKQNNIALGILFSAAIIFLIGISLFGKVVNLFQKGKYDNSYPFSLKIQNSQKNQFVYLSPKENKIYILNVNNLKDDVSQIPQDTKLSASIEINSTNLSNFFKDFIEDKKIKTNLTSVDKARIYLFVNSVNPINIITQNISSVEDQKSEKIISEIFSDSQITSEDLRIEVINATGVYGVGNKVAKMLSSMGGNVIFVKTAEDVEIKSSIFYSGKKGYTVSRLEKLLSFKAQENKEKSISDIVVIIGKDAVKFIE